jgi:hypothetical protein
MVMKQDKLGAYITQLMTTVIDFKEEEFVRELALEELSRLNMNLQEFIIKNQTKVKDKIKEKSKKQLLQEEKKNG